MSDQTEPVEAELTPAMRAVISAGCLGLVFGVGVLQGSQADPDALIFLTDTWSYAPAQAPILHGLFYVANVLLVLGAIGFGLALVLIGQAQGWGLAAGGALILAIAGFTGWLAVFGEGWGLDTGQRVVMTLMALGFGGMPVAVLVQRLRR
jgi:hypothetical protein